MLTACNSGTDKQETSANPFFTEYTTPFGVPPFDQIKNEHFVPAIDKGMEEQNKEIDTIIKNEAAPDFENTIAAQSNQRFLQFQFVQYQ